MGDQGHEKRDINPLKVATVSLICLSALLLIGHYAPYFVFQYTAGKTRSEAPAPSPLYQAGQIPPQPRLQTAAPRDLEEMRKAEDRRLSSYGWVDQANGVVHIPIERAIDLVAQRRNVKTDAPNGTAAGNSAEVAGGDPHRSRRATEAPPAGGPR